jgi:hypothetical protein
MPSPDAPLTGRCACGAVAFEVRAPFHSASYCHCKRCQRRSGAMWSLNAAIAAEDVALVRGRDALRSWDPGDGGWPKVFCGECGGHLYSDGGGMLGVRLGALDGDPGVRPQWHQWLDSSPDWYAIPDDGLPRFPRGREDGE